MTDKPELVIQMVTDVMCPWCFVGSRRFKRFLQSNDYKQQIAPHVRTVLRLDPYILDPRLPASTYDPPAGIYDALESTPYQQHQPPTKRFYYSSKFGNGLDAFDRRITAAADELGMRRFDWSSTGKVGATYDTHRLIWKASQLDDQDGRLARGDPDDCVNALQIRLMDRLYEDFHCDSRDMSDRGYLAGVAHELGLFGSEEEARAWLQSDQGDYEVRQKLKVTEINGVMNIPFYIVNDGADHMSETGSHEDMLRMMQMQVAAHVR